MVFRIFAAKKLTLATDRLINLIMLCKSYTTSGLYLAYVVDVVDDIIHITGNNRSDLLGVCRT